MITQGDNGSIIELTIYGGDGVELNLVGCTASFIFKSKSRKFTKSAEIVDAPSGLIRVVLQSEDLAEDGKYELQVNVVFPSLNKFSTKILNFNVEKSL